ncbi:MAG TPA: recombinase [Gallionella sp.]|nr:recombinase [Gallionella sp.]
MYQFIHISSYSSQASKKSSSTACVKSIVSEADRKPSYIHHMKEVDAPVILFGCSPTAAGDLAEAWGKQNKIRKDGHVLLAGVISVNAEFAHWDDYKRDCIEWLQDKYGDQLKSVVEHTDEGHPHMHFFVVPRDGERFDGLHEGEKARNEFRALKQRTTDQNFAYIAAMKTFQTNFHSAVSAGYGLAKNGPKRRRVSRSAYLAEKEAVNIVSAATLDKTSLIEQGRKERTGIIEQTKREAEQYRLDNNKLADAAIQKRMDEATAKNQQEAAKVKRQAEILGRQQGQKSFERQPWVKKFRAVIYGIIQLGNNQLERLRQQLITSRFQVDSRLAAAKREIAEMAAELASREKDVRHISDLYESVCKMNRDLNWEAKHRSSLTFSESANVPDHFKKPR